MALLYANMLMLSWLVIKEIVFFFKARCDAWLQNICKNDTLGFM